MPSSKIKFLLFLLSVFTIHLENMALQDNWNGLHRLLQNKDKSSEEERTEQNSPSRPEITAKDEKNPYMEIFNNFLEEEAEDITYPKDLTFLSDPKHTTRLQRFTDMEAFPMPAFHGCRNNGLCTFSNVCFSPQDGMLVFKVPGLNPMNSTAQSPMWNEHQSLGTVSFTRRNRWIPYPKYKKLNNVYFTKSMFVLNCWHQRANKNNPAHLLLGFGKLFVASTGFHKANESDPLDTFDMVVYHQCAPPWWPWAQAVDNIIHKYAIKSRVINNITSPNKGEERIFIPWSGQQLADPKPNDVIICGETVYQEPFSLATYLGENHHEVVKKWRVWVGEQLQDESSTAAEVELGHVKECPRQLRFALWNRTEGSALRILTNVDDIRLLVSEYSDIPLSIITASSSTPAEEQISLFRSFYILITPHGSHLANMVFSKQRTAFIEVSPVFFDGSPETNGATFATKWILSLGHTSTEKELSEKMHLCSNRDHTKCNHELRKHFVQSNLIVNTTILRRDIESTVVTLCDSSRFPFKKAAQGSLV